MQCELGNKLPKDFKINNKSLKSAVSFTEANEYSGSRYLRIAILKGFKSEPFHEILGPTKKRGGPAGMILKNGYVIAQWGYTKRADRPLKEGGIGDWKIRKLNEPGTVIEYNDVRINVLAYALTHVWRQPMPMILKENFMDKIGASTTWRWYRYGHAWTEIDGLKMKSVNSCRRSGAGLFMNTEDMARFGMLFLNNGKWKDEQLISETWIEETIEPSTPNVNYGYIWWPNKKGERHRKGLSENIYYAAGFGGNFIVIDKENDVVVVARWLEPDKIGGFMQNVNKALK